MDSYRWWSVLVLVSLSLSVSTASAEKCGANFKVAVNESEPMYYELGRTQKYAGISKDLLDELRDRTGCEFTPVVMNRSYLMKELAAFRVDLVAISVQNEKFDKLAKFLPIRSERRQFLTSKKTAGTAKTYHDLLNNPKTRFVGLPASTGAFFSAEETLRLEKEKRFLTAPNWRDAYQVLARTDGAVVVQIPFIQSYFRNKMDLNKDYVLLVDTDSIWPVGIYYVPKKAQEAEIKLVTKALKEIEADGTWSKILDKYSSGK